MDRAPNVSRDRKFCGLQKNVGCDLLPVFIDYIFWLTPLKFSFFEADFVK